MKHVDVLSRVIHKKCSHLDRASNKLLRMFGKGGQQTGFELLLSMHLRRNIQLVGRTCDVYTS